LSRLDGTEIARETERRFEMAGIFHCTCGTNVIADRRLQRVVRFPDNHEETYCRRDCPELPLAYARREAAEIKVSVDPVAAIAVRKAALRNEAMQRNSLAATAANRATVKMASASL